MDNDTDLGGPAGIFPVTRCSLVRAAASSDPKVRKQAQDTLISAYWKPVYKYIRIQWNISNEDSKDLTQAFFARAVEKSFFDGFDPAKARFRTFVRLCVDGFVANEQRAAGRLKRGGASKHISLDFDSADCELHGHAPAAGANPDDFFRQEWLRSLFAAAVEGLRLYCAGADKKIHFQLFERYDLEAVDIGASLSYAQLAQEFGLSTAQVTNYLFLARCHFRQLVLDQLRAATGNEEEYQLEVRNLFGRNAR